jgi:phage terminase large subunit-like protein
MAAMQESLLTTGTNLNEMSRFEDFCKLLGNPFRYQLFLLMKLPAAFFAGLRVKHLSDASATAVVKYKWFNKNPFKSVYFAVLSMAAELSTGVLCLGFIYKRQPSVSMLVVKTEGNFFKKAVGTLTFTCHDGIAIQAAVEKAVSTGLPQEVVCHSSGTNESGDVVAEFIFTWSFKARL